MRGKGHHMTARQIAAIVFGGVAVIVVAVVLLNFKRTDISQGVTERLALCNAGISNKLGADLKAKVPGLEKGGVLTAEMRQELKGVFMGRDDLPKEDALKMYDRYVQCLDQEKG